MDESPELETFKRQQPFMRAKNKIFKNIVLCALWCCGGLIVAAVSYSSGTTIANSCIIAGVAILSVILHFLLGGGFREQLTAEEVEIPEFKTDLPEDLMSLCPRCQHYARASGCCSQIHENIRSYPNKFYKKCNGLYFVKVAIL